MRRGRIRVWQVTNRRSLQTKGVQGINSILNSRNDIFREAHVRERKEEVRPGRCRVSNARLRNFGFN